MPIIESALGVENSFEIARSSENVVAMAIGLEDYTADLGVPRTMEGKESFYARTRIVIAAKAAGIQPIDSVFSDVGDMEGLNAECVRSQNLLVLKEWDVFIRGRFLLSGRDFLLDRMKLKRQRRYVIAFEEASQKGWELLLLEQK